MHSSKLLIFLENFCSARSIFSWDLPSKEAIWEFRARFARALRHMLVHVYSWMSV